MNLTKLAFQDYVEQETSENQLTEQEFMEYVLMQGLEVYDYTGMSCSIKYVPYFGMAGKVFNHITGQDTKQWSVLVCKEGENDDVFMFKRSCVAPWITNMLVAFFDRIAPEQDRPFSLFRCATRLAKLLQGDFHKMYLYTPLCRFREYKQRTAKANPNTHVIGCACESARRKADQVQNASGVSNVSGTGTPSDMELPRSNQAQQASSAVPALVVKTNAPLLQEQKQPVLFAPDTTRGLSIVQLNARSETACKLTASTSNDADETGGAQWRSRSLWKEELAEKIQAKEKLRDKWQATRQAYINEDKMDKDDPLMQQANAAIHRLNVDITAHLETLTSVAFTDLPSIDPVQKCTCDGCNM